MVEAGQGLFSTRRSWMRRRGGTRRCRPPLVRLAWCKRAACCCCRRMGRLQDDGVSTTSLSRCTSQPESPPTNPGPRAACGAEPPAGRPAALCHNALHTPATATMAPDTAEHVRAPGAGHRTLCASRTSLTPRSLAHLPRFRAGGHWSTDRHQSGTRAEPERRPSCPRAQVKLRSKSTAPPM